MANLPGRINPAYDPIAYMAGRSDAGKRISGDESRGPRRYTLDKRWGADDPATPPGARPAGTPPVTRQEMEQARMMHGETMKGIQAGYLKVGGAQGLPNSGQLMSSGYAPPGKYDGLQGQTPEGGSEGLMAVRGQQGVNRMQRDAVTTNPKAEQLMAAHVARAAAMNGASELHKLGAALTQSMPGQSLS